MERNTDIANRLKEVLLDGRWIANTNYKEQIETINCKQATTKIGSLNTIAALTFHVNYYLAGLLHVFKGGELLIRDQYSFDLPPISSEQQWRKLIEDFLFHAETFVNEVASMPDTKLEETFVDVKYGTYARNIEGVIEHCYYHLGQIVLLKKMILENGH